MAAVTASCGRLPGMERSAVFDTSVSGDPLSKMTACCPLRVRCVVGGATHQTSKDSDHAALSTSSEEWWRKPAGQGARITVETTPFFSDFGGECIESWPSVSDRGLDTSTWTEHHSKSPSKKKASRGVPVFVMLPLDSINPQSNAVNRKRAMNASLLALKSAGVEGIMMDVWWGIVEKDGPRLYNWSGYRELIEMAKKHGLKVQAVMSFHSCGGNVGDSCNIPLPPWVVDDINSNNDIVYTDKYGNRNYEYLSLGVDELPVLGGRTPVQAYGDYMRSFRDHFSDLLGETIVEIQVGMGPAGELRYPGYPEQHGRWRFPGIGEFQCYDKYMLSNLKARAEAILKPDWGLGGPSDAGHYNCWPEDTTFFKRDGGWKTDYGRFFLNWYSEMLLLHGERILAAANGIFRSTGVVLSGKVAGIHWHYNTRSHAAELTAGYYNTRDSDGYLPIARMFGRHGVTLNFTCFEMKDEEQPSHASCSPEGLLRQVALAARTAGVRLAGENALPRFDQAAHDQVVRQSHLEIQANGEEQSYQEPMSAFTFLRMSENLFHSNNWRLFVPFVRHMQEGRLFEPWEREHQETESSVHTAGPLGYEASQALMYN